MALLYHRQSTDKESKVVIRPLRGEGDYVVAITFPEEEGDDENTITELCLTDSEVREAYDLLFNK